MFNSYDISNRNTQIVSTHVNAVTGNITKTYAKSFFKRFHLTSKTAEELLTNEPRLSVKDEYRNINRSVQIIQMVVVGDMEVIAEIMFKEDYEEVVN